DLAAGLGVGLVDLGEGQAEDEVRDLVGRLVLEPAGLLVEAVPAGVLLARVPERLAVVVVEPARVGGHDLEPVLALLQALHDWLGQQVLPLLPVARLERPGLLLGGGGERAGGENGRAETHAELHSVSPRVGGASRAGLPFRSFVSGLSRVGLGRGLPELLELPAEHAADEQHGRLAGAPRVEGRPRRVPLAQLEREEGTAIGSGQLEAPRALAEAVVAGYGGIGIDGRQRTERAERGEEIRDRTLRPRVAGRVGPAALAAHGGHPALPLRQLDARDRGGRNSKEGRGLGGGRRCGAAGSELDHPQVAGERRQERGAAGRHAKRLRRAMASAAAPMSTLGATTTPQKTRRASRAVRVSGENVPPGGAAGRAAASASARA